MKRIVAGSEELTGGEVLGLDDRVGGVVEGGPDRVGLVVEEYEVAGILNRS